MSENLTNPETIAEQLIDQVPIQVVTPATPPEKVAVLVEENAALAAAHARIAELESLLPRHTVTRNLPPAPTNDAPRIFGNGSPMRRHPVDNSREKRDGSTPTKS